MSRVVSGRTWSSNAAKPNIGMSCSLSATSGVYSNRKKLYAHRDHNCNGSHKTAKKGTTEDNVQKAEAKETKEERE